MTDKKKKPASKEADKKTVAVSSGAAAEARAEQSDADVRVLLHEAAWSRMFGKAGAAKNPFSR